ncbi:MurR/RpiR family transcriptional regulator [Virgibacillus sp. LDC-1]|uniref:MurR/RpiR family transcriptional regulator n=1 Tax=Virgibacillus sp. LDC-1 TaxID=3039856 RepID=UPI0024DF0131|nr:MurR/RpiR family transcriptional regulator [Virgibacillus sp. LDC-1]
MNSINEIIKQKYESLSRTQQKAAHYILENMEEITVLSAHKIGVNSNVSEATVHRLAQALEFRSFLEMKQAIHHFMKKDQRVVHKLASTTTVKQESWLEQHFIQEAENILRTNEQLEKKTVTMIAHAFLDANKIWIAGWRMGLSVTSYMRFALQYMLGNTMLIPQGEIAENTAYLRHGEVLFICAFPRYCKKTIQVVKAAKEQGVCVIAITDSPLSPVYTLADYCILAKNKSKSFLDSYTAALSVCHAILKEISYVGGERIKKNIKNMEDYFELFEENSLE